MPLHSIYLIQPLNLEVFQSFKHYHTNAIGKAAWLGDEKFGKLEFLSVLKSFCNQTFKQSIIRHALRSSKLVSFKLKGIFDKTYRKQTNRKQDAFGTPFLLTCLLHPYIFQELTFIIKY